MGLARGESAMLCSEPTLHTRTAMLIIETLLPGVKFAVSTLSPDLYLIKCTGAGVMPPE
jgi:hypothetical protein